LTLEEEVEHSKAIAEDQALVFNHIMKYDEDKAIGFLEVEMNLYVEVIIKNTSTYKNFCYDDRYTAYLTKLLSCICKEQIKIVFRIYLNICIDNDKETLSKCQ